MDRKLFKLPFSKNSQLDWECPTCQKGLMRIKKDTFFYQELSESKKAHSHDYWDPDWMESTYSCLLGCTNEKCGEVISSSGEGLVDLDVDYGEEGVPQQVWEDFFRPKYFHPHLKLFKTPSNTPDEVMEKLNESFRLFFSSPDSASNHVRAALEAMLNNLKVKRFKTAYGKRHIISLHQRIKLLPTKYDELKDLLIAVKWLGNAGSHTGKTLSADDVLDSYEIMEHVLNEIYDNKSTKVKALAKKVNKAKGPSS